MEVVTKNLTGDVTIGNVSDVVEELMLLRQQVALLESAHAILAKNTDIFFILINSMFVFFMQCGFAFLECGAVRSKNTTNILIKNMVDVFVAGICYWAVGYSFAFGEGNSFIGHTYFFSGLNGMIPNPDYALWLWHFVFAATAATIVSGAVAERCSFEAYLVYSSLITAFIYPVVTHWAWAPEGWLLVGLDDGAITFADFAGSGVVHLLGGTCAFAGAVILGPRKGRFTADRTPVHIRGHSVPLAALGGFILLLGFLAFNGGSLISMSKEGDGEIVSRVMVNTVISGSFAAATVLIVNKLIMQHRWSILITLNGALAGMVAACAGCNVYWPWASAVVGTFAGFGYLMWSAIMLKLLKIDDPLDAVAVHVGGGLWGLIAAPLFSNNGGIVYEWSRASFKALGWNMVGAVAIVAWSGVLCVVIFGSMRLLGFLRVSDEIEFKGLDIPKHGEPAYPVEAYGHGWDDSVQDVFDMFVTATAGDTAVPGVPAAEIMKKFTQSYNMADPMPTRRRQQRFENAEAQYHYNRAFDTIGEHEGNHTGNHAGNHTGNHAGNRTVNHAGNNDDEALKTYVASTNF